MEPGSVRLASPRSGRGAPPDACAVRDRLVEALRLDLIGPSADDELAEEQLPGRTRPSKWYLSGFLAPVAAPPDSKADPDEDDDLEEVPADAGLPEESTEDRKAAKKSYFPSSMGLSFFVPAETGALDVLVRWGEYAYEGGGAAEPDPHAADPSDEDASAGKHGPVWQRRPREAFVSVRLGSAEAVRDPEVVPRSGGLHLHVVERKVEGDAAAHVPSGTRSVSIFLVNRRPPLEERSDEAFVFQAELVVRCAEGFVPRPDLRGTATAEWDESVADLHYADSPEYATGHGVSADWTLVDDGCHELCSTWIPQADVEKTATSEIPDVELGMDALAELSDGAAAVAALKPLAEKYRDWIRSPKRGVAALPDRHRGTAQQLLTLAESAATRIERGVAVLASDPEALDSFRMANRAVAHAMRRRRHSQGLPEEAPRWRAFQLAFILLNLPGLADPAEPSREIVDLLFFPTGGGKTEAYLGLAAFAMVLRRLRHPGSDGLGGAGVSVIMRYTLRLLTLDQLSRAAGLVCALELEREKDPKRFGAWPFEIGLWVGKAATPNVLGRKGDTRPDSARAKVRQYKANPRGRPSPIPLENCPWCGTRFDQDSFSLQPDSDKPRELWIICANPDCEFVGDRHLPIVAVDEPLYRRLPAFLIATVDKFASLPWVGPSGVLLGGADRCDATGFYGPAEPRMGRRLEAPLAPPDLVIQDELHLIAGPLGTMAGLYETAIEALCVREIDGRKVRPKVVASTATVRRAQDQVQALFARPLTQIFPPPGPDRRDSFFATTRPAAEVRARLYVGIAAQGRNPKVVLARSWLALMGAAERAYRDAGGHKNEANPADPYMTVLAYFNSLRELGGSRRLLEEEVRHRLRSYSRRRRVGEAEGLFRDRKTFSEVLELTSRVPTDKVAEARRRLEAPFHDAQRVDCAIATNMISVGLDIQRLGLMTVLGQPKTHAEYIQATSRVGRDDARPGLVATILNVHKPRDRSHYERFRHYHETFYRSVEVGSVTPFSARALDRGFSGALVALARHLEPDLSPPEGVERIPEVGMRIRQRLLDAFLDRVRHQPITDEAEVDERLRSVQNRVVDLLDSWRKVFDDYSGSGVPMQYQTHELKEGRRPLLREMLDRDFETEHHRKFRANRSLRDVEPSVNLFLKDLGGRDVEDGG